MRVTTSVALPAALAAGLLLGGCVTATGQAAAPTSAAPAPTTDPPPTPTPAPPDAGSPEAPARPGVDTLPLGEPPVYDVQLGPALLDAWDAITAHYAFNDPAPEGSTYVLLPVAATYVGDGPFAAKAWLDLGITFVAADGRTFGPSEAIVPDDLSAADELRSGETSRGNIAFVVPRDALPGAVWRVESLYPGSGGEPVVFALG